MAREIERKFLIEELPSSLAQRDGVEIEQGYLAIADDAEVRLRRAGEKLTLTVKRGGGEDREEYEVPLEPSQLEVLWEGCAGRRLRKRRYLVPLEGGLRAEVDVYGGALDGLRVVEVEFRSAEAAAAFAPPPWFGRELTGERRFANQALAVQGLPPEARAAARPGGR